MEAASSPNGIFKSLRPAPQLGHLILRSFFSHAEMSTGKDWASFHLCLQAPQISGMGLSVFPFKGRSPGSSFIYLPFKGVGEPLTLLRSSAWGSWNGGIGCVTC